MTLIQRFGSALNLNIHFHMLVLDGAYLVGTEPPVFRRVGPPGEAELQALVERLAERVGRALERRGLLVRDAESTYLELLHGFPVEGQHDVTCPEPGLINGTCNSSGSRRTICTTVASSLARIAAARALRGATKKTVNGAPTISAVVY